MACAPLPPAEGGGGLASALARSAETGPSPWTGRMDVLAMAGGVEEWVRSDLADHDLVRLQVLQAPELHYRTCLHTVVRR